MWLDSLPGNAAESEYLDAASGEGCGAETAGGSLIPRVGGGHVNNSMG